jgi:hypothetical protein
MILTSKCRSCFTEHFDRSLIFFWQADNNLCILQVYILFWNSWNLNKSQGTFYTKGLTSHCGWHVGHSHHISSHVGWATPRTTSALSWTTRAHCPHGLSAGLAGAALGRLPRHGKGPFRTRYSPETRRCGWLRQRGADGGESEAAKLSGLRGKTAMSVMIRGTPARFLWPAGGGWHGGDDGVIGRARQCPYRQRWTATMAAVTGARGERSRGRERTS